MGEVIDFKTREALVDPYDEALERLTELADLQEHCAELQELIQQHEMQLTQINEEQASNVIDIHSIGERHKQQFIRVLIEDSLEGLMQDLSESLDRIMELYDLGYSTELDGVEGGVNALW